MLMMLLHVDVAVRRKMPFGEVISSVQLEQLKLSVTALAMLLSTVTLPPALLIVAVSPSTPPEPGYVPHVNEPGGPGVQVHVVVQFTGKLALTA